MSDAQVKRFLLYALSAAAAAALAYVLTRYVLAWLLPFLIAAAAAAAIEPAVRFLQEKLRFRRGFSSLLLTLFLLFLLGGFASLLGTTLSSEAYALLSHAPALLDALPESADALFARLNQYCAACPPWMREAIEASLARYAAEAGDLLSSLIAQALSALASLAQALPSFFLGIATSVLAIYFTSSSWPDIQQFFSSRFPGKTLQKMSALRRGVASSAARWLRAELALCGITFLQLLAGFLFLRQPYAMLLAMLITLVDALPVFGTGTILLPWALAESLFQNIPKSIALCALFLLTLIVRNVLEPRFLGAQAGLPPIASLLAMYLGFRMFGVGGMVLFPFLLLLIAQLYRGEKTGEAAF